MTKTSLAEPLPFRDDSFDLAIDSYVFCHFTNDALRLRYRREIARVVKPGGHFFSSVFSTEDAYYARIRGADWNHEKLVVDPNNGITKRLYTESEIKQFFAQEFSMRYFLKFEFEDQVLGELCLRSILISVLTK